MTIRSLRYPEISVPRFMATLAKRVAAAALVAVITTMSSRCPDVEKVDFG